MSTTVDIGIDLGTTNSVIAARDGVETVVIHNTEDDELTPSAIAFTPGGEQYVGRRARDLFFQDSSNAEIEFKLRMGLGERGAKYFSNAKRSLLPEEMSAEILKALLSAGNAKRQEVIREAVVTVPAAFALPNCQATSVACEKAGLSRHLLLLEPVAASLVYGIEKAAPNSVWMIYDFGGGTFDAAITQLRDGIIQLLGHAGEEHLGGKLLDWDIIDCVLAPVLRKAYNLPSFVRGNPRWKVAFGVLKILAEKGKMVVCKTHRPTTLRYDGAGWKDDSGRPVSFDIPLTPEVVREKTLPYFARSERLCRDAVEKCMLRPGDVKRIVLVGGATLNPYLQSMLSEAFPESALDRSIDPLTVVARGAALYASRMPLRQRADARDTSVYTVDLMNYQAGGIELQAPVAGIVRPPAGASVDQCTIEFRERQSRWSSGAKLLKADGFFETTLIAEPGRKCTYEILVCSRLNQRLRTQPAEMSYEAGNISGDLPLNESIGVATADNRVDVFFTQGTPLTDNLSRQRVHRSAYSFRAGQTSSAFRIPIVAGDDPRADRNRLVGVIQVSPSDFAANLPINSDVNITLSINQSRLLKATATITFLGQTFHRTLPITEVALNLDELQRRLKEQNARFEKIRTAAMVIEEGRRAREIITQVERENAFDQTRQMLDEGEQLPESLQAADGRLRSLMRQIDEAEDALEWSILVIKANRELQDAIMAVSQFGDARDKADVLLLQETLSEAIQSNRPIILRAKTESAVELRLLMQRRDDKFWVKLFTDLQARDEIMTSTDPAVAQLVAVGLEAIERNDREKMEYAVKQLISHVVSPETMLQGFGGSTYSGYIRY